MEKFLLRSLLACDKLNIVDEKQVGHAVFAAEGLDVSLLNGGDELIRKILSFDINNAKARVTLINDIADGVQ